MRIRAGRPVPRPARWVLGGLAHPPVPGCRIGSTDDGAAVRVRVPSTERRHNLRVATWRTARSVCSALSGWADQHLVRLGRPVWNSVGTRSRSQAAWPRGHAVLGDASGAAAALPRAGRCRLGSPAIGARRTVGRDHGRGGHDVPAQCSVPTARRRVAGQLDIADGVGASVVRAHDGHVQGRIVGGRGPRRPVAPGPSPTDHRVPPPVLGFIVLWIDLHLQ